MFRRSMWAALTAVVFLVVPGLFAHAAGDPPIPAPAVTPAELADGWISLFDGKTLYGWQANSDVNWSVGEGAIRADRGKAGLLLTTFEIAEFDFRCEYFLQKGGNSGIFLRTPFSPKDPRRDCYELNLCDSHPAFPTGSIVGHQKANGTFRGEGEWMLMEVHVEGPRIRARLNGTSVIDFTDSSPSALRIGHIGLQMNGGAVAFRKIALRRLESEISSMVAISKVGTSSPAPKRISTSSTKRSAPPAAPGFSRPTKPSATLYCSSMPGPTARISTAASFFVP